MMDTVSYIKQELSSLKAEPDHSRLREVIGAVAKNLPKTPETVGLFEDAFSLIGTLTDPAEKRDVLIGFARELPSTGAFLPLYARAMEAAVDEADTYDEAPRRITELVRLANELPAADDFLALRFRAWRLAMGMADKPRHQKAPLPAVAKQLPKVNDYTFYRRYTLLGIASQLPKEEAYLGLYKEAVEFAIEAVPAIEEPYYRKYALLYIADMLPKTGFFHPIYVQAMLEAYKAAKEMRDPFAREWAFLDMVKITPKTADFFPMLQELLDEALKFFTVKSWMGDVEVFDVVDFIFSAEESGMYESKKNRFSRGKYASILALELEKLTHELNDTRFITALKPYTHVWVQPKQLRDAVKKVVDHLESLSATYHGKEIERPVFLMESHLEGDAKAKRLTAVAPDECIAVDLGATNTVVMRKKRGARPEFIAPENISRRYGNVSFIPTILSAESNSIGAEVTGDSPICNIKQMLLDGNPKGREHTERFFRLLYGGIRKTAPAPGWFSVFSKPLAEVAYITVPVGFTDYKNALKEIADKTFRGMNTDFIEEPLAAAFGYQVVDEREKVVMIIDFGGSTLNTMILRLNMKELHVVAKPERALVLGGHDIDVWLAEHLAGKIGLRGRELPYKLICKAEELKIALSTSNEAPFEWNGKEVLRLTRQEFEEVLDSHDFYRFIDRTIAHIVKKAEKVGLRKERIEAVLLTGGSSQIPSFKDKIGDVFPALRVKNLIYDHSPLSAVAEGAALYGTRDVVDRHLAMAYAARYATTGKDASYSYSIVFEKGEPLPFEKSFSLSPAQKLGPQKELFIELYEVPDSLIARRWVREAGVEYLKQELSEAPNMALKALKTITLSFKEPVAEPVDAAFVISESGELSVSYGPAKVKLDTGLRLQ